MMTLVIGGSGSGKSAYAESLLDGYKRKYYLATMLAEDEQARQKVNRHRRMRAGKGFVTIEQPCDIARAAWAFGQTGDEGLKDGTCPKSALLECVSNLVANEMFLPTGMVQEDVVAHKVLEEIALLRETLDELVIVSNNVFEDGIHYDESTMAYLRALAAVNAGLAQMAERVTEVVVGIPVVIKDKL